jgi:hypothetical protein
VIDDLLAARDELRVRRLDPLDLPLAAPGETGKA